MKGELERAVAIQGMQENWILAIMPKYGNSALGSWKWNFSKIFHFCRKVTRFRFQRALNHPQILSLSQVMQENVIMLKYGNSAPDSQKWNFSKIFHFCRKVTRFRFQRALNHPQILSLSQVMQENVIMLKYGNSAPDSQKWNFSKNFIFLKRSSNFAFTSLQPPAVMQENILPKKLSLGLNFSTPSGGVTSPSLKGSMVWA